MDSGPPLIVKPRDAIVGLLSGAIGFTDAQAARIYGRGKPFWDAMWYLYGSAVSFDDASRQCTEAFMRLAPPSQLYLFSEQDAVFPRGPGQIEDFIESTAQRSMAGGIGRREITLFRKKWATGSHVQLLRAHEEEYNHQVEQFLRHVLDAKERAGTDPGNDSA